MTDTPPTDHDAAMFDDAVEPPRWPKVVGIISIVWASLGLACGVCGMAGPFISTYFVPPEMKGQMPPMAPPPLMLAAQVAGMANAVLLLVAGIMLVSRKPVSKPMHLVYGLLSFPLFVVTMMLSMQQQAALAQWAQQNPDTPYGKAMQGPGAALGQTIGWVIGCLMMLYPVFCVIWFGFVKRRAVLDVPREEIV